MQNRNANGIGIERRSGTRQGWDRADQSRPANELQKISSTPESVRVNHRLNSVRIAY
jgi:hypothetical protein